MMSDKEYWKMVSDSGTSKKTVEDFFRYFDDFDELSERSKEPTISQESVNRLMSKFKDKKVL